MLWILVVVALVAWLLAFTFTTAVAIIKVPNFSHARDLAWSFFSFCFALGALTMVLVQITRLLIPLRGHYHRHMLKTWFKAAVLPPNHQNFEAMLQQWQTLLLQMNVSSPTSLESFALLEFELPALRGSEASRWFKPDVALLYDLPLEQLCGQLSAAGDVALEAPQRTPHFALCLVGFEGAAELLKLVPPVVAEPPDAQAPSAQTHIGVPPSEGSVTNVRGGEVSEQERVALARSALARLVQRRIDGFQIIAGALWRRTLRASVVTVSLGFAWAITFSGMSISQCSPFECVTTGLSYLLYGTLAGTLAGFLAMFLRDAAAILELKRRQT